MKNTMLDTKDLILALKKVKKEKGLSIDKIYEMVEANDPSRAVSRTSVARVFRKNSENLIFKWEGTLKPIANALLDFEEIEASDDTDTQAYKSILILKKEIIESLTEQLNNAQNVSNDTAHYLKSIEHLEKQLEYKDKRIDQLLDANDRMQIIIDRLTQQLLSCPCSQGVEVP